MVSAETWMRNMKAVKTGKWEAMTPIEVAECFEQYASTDLQAGRINRGSYQTIMSAAQSLRDSVEVAVTAGDIEAAVEVLEAYDWKPYTAFLGVCRCEPAAAALWESEDSVELSDSDRRWARRCLFAAAEYIHSLQMGA